MVNVGSGYEHDVKNLAAFDPFGDAGRYHRKSITTLSPLDFANADADSTTADH